MSTAIILAGGLGTRLRQVVADVPKPMAQVADRPFLEWLISYWIRQGVDRFILAVGYRHEVIVNHFGRRHQGARIDYVIEETPLGTGGGLLLAGRQLEGEKACLVLNGDTFFGVDLLQLRQFHELRKSSWTFGLFPTADSSRYLGMRLDQDGRVRELSVRSQEGEAVLANGGLYWVETDILQSQNGKDGQVVSLESDILNALLSADARLYGFRSDSAFIDIGIPDDYRRAQTALPVFMAGGSARP